MKSLILKFLYAHFRPKSSYNFRTTYDILKRKILGKSIFYYKKWDIKDLI